MCYDEACGTSGTKGVVAKRISDLELRPVRIHCFGHSLSLTTSDANK